MRITFVLPMHTAGPVGGFKVVYEYANGLAERGHQVTVLHRRTPSAPLGRRQRLLEALTPWAKRLASDSENALAPWFSVHPDVCMEAVPEVSEETLPDADVLIATAWQTAHWIKAARHDKGTKYYLIQHDETCMDGGQEAGATWHLPLHKIVIARWLKRKVEEAGELATHIPNGMDFTHLGIDTPIAKRLPCVGMLCHAEFNWKGTADGLQALIMVKRRFPSLKVVLFGTGPRPRQVPRWAAYRQSPSPRELHILYNQCSIFVQPSWTEGWGLTATEAMACGCALVTTSNGGSEDYAEDGGSALVVPPRQPARLADEIGRLLQDEPLRQSIAQTGYENVQKFTWIAAVDRLEALLLRQSDRCEPANEQKLSEACHAY